MNKRTIANLVTFLLGQLHGRALPDELLDEIEQAQRDMEVVLAGIERRQSLQRAIEVKDIDCRSVCHGRTLFERNLFHLAPALVAPARPRVANFHAPSQNPTASP